MEDEKKNQKINGSVWRKLSHRRCIWCMVGKVLTEMNEPKNGRD